MSALPLPDKLPVFLYPLFWDVDPSKVNPQKSPKYVANRLLDIGDVEAARWALRVFSKKILTETLKTIRGFSLKSARYWAMYLGIQEQEVACLQTSYQKMRKSHWMY